MTFVTKFDKFCLHMKNRRSPHTERFCCLLDVLFRKFGYDELDAWRNTLGELKKSLI